MDSMSGTLEGTIIKRAARLFGGECFVLQHEGAFWLFQNKMLADGQSVMQTALIVRDSLWALNNALSAYEFKADK